MHSADVVHSFWVPRVGGKRDVNPQPRPREGENPRFNYLSFNIEEPGYYSGQCAEFCGASHAIMRTAIVAVAPAEFAAWVASMTGSGAPQPTALSAPADTSAAPPADTLARAQGAPPPAPPLQGPATPAAPLTEVQRGQQLFTSRVCIACHTIQGTSARGVLGPNLTRFGSRRTVGAGARPNTQANVEAWIKDPASLKPGALMPGSARGAAGMPPPVSLMMKCAQLPRT
jgi:cytochrome c oxidase subunit 2